jgi:rhodanese-related sulfurtransferase
MFKHKHLFVTLLVVLALALGACGGGRQAEAPAEAEAPLAQEEAAPLAEEATEEVAEEEAPAEEAPAEEPAAEATEAPAEEAAATEAPTEEAAEEAEVDAVVAGWDSFLGAIPEGYLAVGQIDAVKELIDAGAVVIDVREEGEYAEGHIPGAVNVPIRTLAQNLDKIPADQPVLVYCASGHRAGMAMSSLQALGYDNVRSFPGGWRAWSEAEEEVSTEATEGETYDVPEIDPAMLAAVDEFLSNVPDGFLVVRTVEDLEAAQENGAVVIDVRQPDEFEGGHIANALSIPIREIAQNLDQVPTDAPVIVYCASGHRAAMSTAALQSMGYTNVRSFPAGYGAWEAAQGEAGDVPEEVAASLESNAVVAGVDEFLTNIPEGYLAVGNIDAFKDMLENTDVYLVDVREESEYAEGHIPGAVNIPIRTLADNLDKIPADQPVMVYCASGHRAGMALAALQQLGYTNTKSFPPGWRGWSGAEEEVSTEATEAGAFDLPEIDGDMLAAVAEFLNNIPEGYYSLGSDVEKLDAAIEAGATVIDVRQPDEFEAGAITGAINIPIRELGQNLDQIPTDAPVIVYCASGHRAAISTGALHTLGLDNVRSFPPGYGAWEAAQ